jgi:superfamily I DNA and/or RNA helicase
MQLRPKVANYDLSVENMRRDKYNLDMSLFERICSMGVPSTTTDTFDFPLAQLTTQRRMRSEIAELVRRPLYPTLKDHPSVQNYPPVSGMYHSLFWFDHEYREDGSGPMELKETSHSNKFEATMATNLVAYLMKQDGYREGDIVVLTPYLGQLRKLRESFSQVFSVQLSERDNDDLAELDFIEIPSEQTSEKVVREPLSQTVRIATVNPISGSSLISTG